jgi:thiol-disulfide isomerase/thioredoxin
MPLSLIDFYAADCGHCQAFMPTFLEASNHSSSSHIPVNFETKECYGPGWVDGKDAAFCKELGIDKFPTIKLVEYSDDQKVTSAVDYEGPRSVDGLINFAKEHVPGNVLEQSVNFLFSLFASHRVKLQISNFI